MGHPANGLRPGCRGCGADCYNLRHSGVAMTTALVVVWFLAGLWNIVSLIVEAWQQRK